MKGLVQRRTKEFERRYSSSTLSLYLVHLMSLTVHRHSEILRQSERPNRSVFKWILRSASKQGKPNVVLANETSGDIPVPPPVPKELSSATPSPALTPSVSTEKLTNRKSRLLQMERRTDRQTDKTTERQRRMGPALSVTVVQSLFLF